MNRSCKFFIYVTFTINVQCHVNYCILINLGATYSMQKSLISPVIVLKNSLSKKTGTVTKPNLVQITRSHLFSSYIPTWPQICEQYVEFFCRVHVPLSNTHCLLSAASFGVLVLKVYGRVLGSEPCSRVLHGELMKNTVIKPLHGLQIIHNNNINNIIIT